MFENAIFTDVLASEAINGHDGFNFQAVSAGIDGTDQRNTIEFMLHEVSRRWPLDADPLAHPETFAHIVQDGKHYISRGKSIGDTNTGRRGNQLTQTAVIPFADYDRFDHGFPVQLFASSHWSLKKATSKVSQTWEDTGINDSEPFEEQNEALMDWAKTTPWVSQNLAEFIAVLNRSFEEPSKSQKIVVLYERIEDFIRWVALASLLVDGEKPMLLEFKAGVDSPWNSRGHILGVPRALEGEDLSGAFVIDTVQESMGTAEADDASRTVADWFLTQDVGDAQTKNDVFRRWLPLMNTELAAWGATIAAAEPVAGADLGWKGSLKILGVLGQENLNDDLELYAPDFLTAVEKSTLHTEEDFEDAARAAKALVDAGQEEYALSVLKVGLNNLAYAPQKTANWALPLVESAHWNWVQDPEARTYIATELCNFLPKLDSAPRAMTYVMVLLKPLQEVLTSRQTEIILQRGIDYLHANPAVQSDLSRWIFGEAIAVQTVHDLYVQASEALTRWKSLGGSLQNISIFTQIMDGTWAPLYAFAPRTEETQKKQRLLDDLQGALRLAAQPPEVRSTQVEQIPVWLQEVVLDGTSPARDPKLWAAWLSAHKVKEDTLQTVISQLNNELKHQGPPKETKRWSPLIKALENYRQYPDAVAAINLYKAKVKEIDTVLKKASRFFGFGRGLTSENSASGTRES